MSRTFSASSSTTTRCVSGMFKLFMTVRPASPVPNTTATACCVGSRPCTRASISARRKRRASSASSKTAWLGSMSDQSRAGLCKTSPEIASMSSWWPSNSAMRVTKASRPKVTAQPQHRTCAPTQLPQTALLMPKGLQHAITQIVQHGPIGARQLLERCGYCGPRRVAPCDFDGIREIDEQRPMRVTRIEENAPHTLSRLRKRGSTACPARKPECELD